MNLKLVKKNNPESLVSSAAGAIPPSGIREFFDIVASMPDCISLGVGEPDFVTPWRISDVGMYAIKDGYTHYTSNRGIQELRKLLADFLKRNYGAQYDPEEEILITMGVSQGLDLAFRSILNPGDEVIIFEPCYVSYPSTIRLALGNPVTVQTRFSEEFTIDIKRVKQAINPATKAILLNYPSNPTGSVIGRETLERIAELSVDHNLIVLADEIYSALFYEKERYSILNIPEMKERTIYLNGFSKSHAMTGWRLGYVAAPKYLTEVMLKIHQYTALCAPSM
ncbi:MAG TPA: aminotransferase class I/II-fold pyridoxal phosphate-dependent enzyme, partial [Spirochaetes bacterium]|nr:aminotransferase class I/II-fold pyridoxal phosphate-dependent enzyme [Spirochaetota bacterium]